MSSPLYLDTSALIKLYIQEPGSIDVKNAVAAASRIGSSWLAFVEVHAAITRAAKGQRITKAQARRILGQFDQDWQSYDGVLVEIAVVEAAAQLADTHGLRGYDATHLACALQYQVELQKNPVVMAQLKPGEKLEILFATYDNELKVAARSEGLMVL